ncbi:hypothetical protein BOTBODRAFT_499276 [Botryobasidium botryosum FD-172 SS1]|uniref:Uncharacterized protein n=1 Tax=Botryobasidium botryosum (strain FD-172 SS1) TaxID=930990 RepID=A0A067MF11_BOTB1|nr:hypothetical protein BOTBODRAFT_499276 [Botryobasidium botryosum FD-172 SS1]
MFHQLCLVSGYEPSADLSGVVRLGTQPLGRGGFGECWQGCQSCASPKRWYANT